MEHPGPKPVGYMAPKSPRVLIRAPSVAASALPRHHERGDHPLARHVRVPGELRAAKARFARGLRDHGMRLSETGSGEPIIESCGAVNPVDRKAFALLGITTETQANQLGAGLFAAARVREAAA